MLSEVWPQEHFSAMLRYFRYLCPNSLRADMGHSHTAILHTFLKGLWQLFTALYLNHTDLTIDSSAYFLAKNIRQPLTTDWGLQLKKMARSKRYVETVTELIKSSSSQKKQHEKKQGTTITSSSGSSGKCQPRPPSFSRACQLTWNFAAFSGNEDPSGGIQE